MSGLRSQELIVGAEGKRSSFRNALSAAAEFGLRGSVAESRLRRIVERCSASWKQAIAEAGIDEPQLAAELRQGLLLSDDD